jgi:hypothetical protein
MSDEEVEDLTGLESLMARQDANAEEGAKEQSSLTTVGAKDPTTAGTAQSSASAHV